MKVDLLVGKFEKYRFHPQHPQISCSVLCDLSSGLPVCFVSLFLLLLFLLQHFIDP